jgi:hypothetical protein
MLEMIQWLRQPVIKCGSLREPKLYLLDIDNAYVTKYRYKSVHKVFD